MVVQAVAWVQVFAALNREISEAPCHEKQDGATLWEGGHHIVHGSMAKRTVYSH